MKEETVRQLGRDLAEDAKVVLRVVGAVCRLVGRNLGRLWRSFNEAFDVGAKVRGVEESDAVKIEILRSSTTKYAARNHPLAITITAVSLVALIGLFAWLVFLPVEIGGTFEGDLKLDTEGSGMAFQVPEGLYRYDFVPDEHTGVFNMHLLEVNRTDAPLINKSMSVYINGGQGTLKGSYSIKAPSFMFLVFAQSGKMQQVLVGEMFSQ